MTNLWRAASADNDPKALKAAVDLAAVCLHYGISLSPSGERLVGLCPFHDDTSESFAVWTIDDVQICGCWSCDFGTGDLFDFIQRYKDCDFRTAMNTALLLRDQDLPDAPEVAASSSQPVDRDALGRLLEPTRTARLDLLNVLLHDRGINVPPEWLHDQFRVGVARDRVMIPHFNRAGEISAMKRRSPDQGWTPVATKGSKLDELYGVWRTKSRRQVVLCEGESDTWTVAYLLRDEPVNVYGLPSGVSTKPRESWVDLLTDQHVTLLFDADWAGREGAGRWAATLLPVAKSVRVACLPDGTDATSAGDDVTAQAIAEAWPAVNVGTLPVQRQGNRYIRATSEDREDVIVSDFVLDVQRLIVMDDGGIVFEVATEIKQATQLLTDHELASTDRMRRWSAERALSWKGSTRDLSDLIELLKAESILVPRVRGTDIVGLHGQSFVLPSGIIGHSGWGYVPPENDIDLGSMLELEGGEWDRLLPWHLTHLHQPDVITPIVGWVAAAPLRSLVPKFPVLAVTGGSGWGKTTLLSTILDAFGFWCGQPTTLTGTTAHGVQSYAGSTNSFPIWMDEYRPGARVDAKFALDQVIRDAWDGSSSVKGGMSENRMRIKKLPARAPMVVTGEDSFNETSHAERMVMVPVPRTGKSVDALLAVQGGSSAGFGRAYLEWLLAQLRADTLPTPPDIPDRPAQARAVARWGYSLLQQFCSELLNLDLPAFDDTRVTAEHDETNREPIILEALIESLDKLDRSGTPISWLGEDGCLYTKPVALCKWVEQSTDLQMPGKSRAVRSWLVEQYGAQDVRHQVYGRVLQIPDGKEKVYKSADPC